MTNIFEKERKDYLMNDNLKVVVVLLAKLMISLFDNNEERELNDSEVDQDFEKLKLALNMLESER